MCLAVSRSISKLQPKQPAPASDALCCFYEDIAELHGNIAPSLVAV
jgi:hypothetical protein